MSSSASAPAAGDLKKVPGPIRWWGIVAAAPDADLPIRA